MSSKGGMPQTRTDGFSAGKPTAGKPSVKPSGQATSQTGSVKK